MTDRSPPPPDFEVRLLASPDPDLAAVLAGAGFHYLGRFGVAEVWVPVNSVNALVPQ